MTRSRYYQDELEEADQMEQLLGVFPGNPKLDRDRQQANAELIQLLAQYLVENPTQRFGQALRNLEIIREHRMANPAAPCDWVNEFNTEPTEMLSRVKAMLARKP